MKEPEYAGKGEWDISVDYTPGDVVGNLGIAYLCKVANIGIVPTNESYWRVFAYPFPESGRGPAGAKGDDGTIVAVGDTAPSNPSVGDLWVDTSGI